MIISNNLIGRMPIPEDAIIRINIAWMKSVDEIKELLDNSEHQIYLDYPSGRTKPPRPDITLDEAIELSKHEKVKYFAVSNAEDIDTLTDIMSRTDKTFVPKIETAIGVRNIPLMIEAGITVLMLDKEDLYVNIGADSKRFEELVDEVRNCGIKVLELQGVCFE